MKKIQLLDSLNDKEFETELSIADEMIEYYTEVKKKAAEKMLNGASYAGWKLMSRSNARKIVDESELIKKANNYHIDTSELFEFKLLSYPQIVKKFKDKKEFLVSVNDILNESITNYYVIKKEKNNEKEN